MKIINYYKNFKSIIKFIKKCREKDMSFGKFKLLTTKNGFILIDELDNETLNIKWN